MNRRLVRHELYLATWDKHLAWDLHDEWPPFDVDAGDRALLEELYRAGSPLDWAFLRPVSMRTLEAVHRRGLSDMLQMLACRIHHLLDLLDLPDAPVKEGPVHAGHGLEMDAEEFLELEFPELLFPASLGRGSRATTLLNRVRRDLLGGLEGGATVFRWTGARRLAAVLGSVALTGVEAGQVWSTIEWTVHLQGSNVLLGLGSCAGGVGSVESS